jgi:4-oxalocrotonate tautomerase
MCAGFPAGGLAHHLINRTDQDVVYLEIGDRTLGDEAATRQTISKPFSGPMENGSSHTRTTLATDHLPSRGRMQLPAFFSSEICHAATTQERPMPLVRIDLRKGKSSAYRRTVGHVVYEAMRTTIDVPHNDRFQIIAEHDADDLICDPDYLGIHRTADCVLIQVTLSSGRTVEKKRAFYTAIADGLNVRLGLRKEDVFINLVEVSKENWSFGNGIAQYVA